MKSPTEIRSDREFAENEAKKSMARSHRSYDILSSDIRQLLDTSEGRRVVRMIFGPQFGNLFGANSDRRNLCVAIHERFLEADAKYMSKLNKHEEDDQNGW